MSFTKVARDPRAYAAIAVSALAAAAWIGGAKGLIGMFLGITSATFGVIILWYLIAVIGKAMTEGGNPTLGTIMVVLGVFLKLPLLVAANMASVRVGEAAQPCFLTGLLLVYSGLVAWAMARH